MFKIKILLPLHPARDSDQRHSRWSESRKTDNFETDLTQQQLDDFSQNPLSTAVTLLGNATTRIIYDLERFITFKKPVFAATLARETHVSDLLAGEESKVQVSFTYSDGFGREIQQKIQAEAGLAPVRDAQGVLRCNQNLQPTEPRWVGTGRTIFNNKGKPVKQYEHFFSPTHTYEDEADLVECGVTPIIHYDPLERVIRTDLPNGTFSKVEFDAWQQQTWDENDTVWESRWYRERQGTEFAGSDPSQVAERRAAKLTAEVQQKSSTERTEYGTPTIAHLDVLGRPFLTIADNGTEGKYETHVKLDIEGNPRLITDARKNPVMEYAYDMIGSDEDEEDEEEDTHRIYLKSMDAGERWTLNNVAGNPIRTWDSRGHQIRQAYDALQRPTHLYVKGGNHGQEILAERTVYGEGIKDAVKYNLRGEVYQQYDGAGVVTNQEYDFKGNLKQSSRQLAKDYKQRLDWNRTVLLETETFTSKTAYDALDRPIWLKMSDNSEIKPTYNEANFLDKVEVRLRGATERENQEEKPKWTEFVKNIEYDAKGQRTLIVYGNGVQTNYTYDPETFRLTHLLTKGKDGKHLQDLHYTYDPVSNITEIRDDAQQTIFFNNDVVSPSSKYEYDALYRLIRAEGREHLGQTGGKLNSPKPTSDTDIPRVNLPHPGNGQAMGRYQQQYVYDEVGNILEMIHHGTNPEHPGWRRCYQYDLYSNRLLSTGYQSNPLVSCETRYAAESVYPQVYPYDPHGNMIRMPHLANHGNGAANMHWDFEDQLQSVDLGGGGKAYYVYDADGQRVRKVVEKGAGLIEERIYLGDFELFRRRNNNGLKLERETLHIMDDEQRITLVETKTFDENKIDTPKPVIRYQLGNYLGSASLELDKDGAVISYEEYYPYGSTSYQAGRSQAEVSLKRYRYTGKERDEESGFYYHGARYYAAWLGRWISCDPPGIVDGLNIYWFVRDNPIRFLDKTGEQANKNIRINFTEEDGKIIPIVTTITGTTITIRGSKTIINYADEEGMRISGSYKELNLGQIPKAFRHSHTLSYLWKMGKKYKVKVFVDKKTGKSDYSPTANVIRIPNYLTNLKSILFLAHELMHLYQNRKILKEYNMGSSSYSSHYKLFKHLLKMTKEQFIENLRSRALAKRALKMSEQEYINFMLAQEIEARVAEKIIKLELKAKGYTQISAYSYFSAAVIMVRLIQAREEVIKEMKQVYTRFSHKKGDSRLIRVPKTLEDVYRDLFRRMYYEYKKN